MSTDRPILFSAPMIRALLDGSKTQTRRILKPQPELFEVSPGKLCDVGVMDGRVWKGSNGTGILTNQRIPYGVSGDLLWVRETWLEGYVGRDGVWDRSDDQYHYRASEPDIEGVDDGDGYSLTNQDGSLKSPWKSPIFMPRTVSRITLAITDVRIERLQDISEADALAEGVVQVGNPGFVVRGFDYDTCGLAHNNPVTPYAKLWDYINGPGAWDANPWVVALTFTVHRQNVDAFLAQRQEAA